METVLYSFGGGSPTGYRPEGGVVMDTAGNLYGTANSGGNGFGLDGTLFELSPAAGGGWTQTVLHSFGAYEEDGINPTSTLIFDTKGNLYGTTYAGGANQAGMVFELTPQTSGGWTEQALYDFGATSTDAAHPFAGLIFNSAGNLFGTTKYGGTNGSGSTGGTAFEIETGASVSNGTIVTLTPASLTFASTTEGVETAAQVVTLKNTSTTTAVTITAGGITFAGTNPTSFIQTATTCGSTLAAGASCTISVAFKPAASGALSGRLSVADSGAGSPQTVALTGTGLLPAPTATLTPSTLTFPTTTVGDSSVVQVVTLKDTSTTTALVIGSIVTNWPSGPQSFFAYTTTCPSTLAAGASCTVSITFKPAATGPLSATLSITDNATGSPQQVTLSGIGATSSAPPPLQFIRVTPCRVADTRNAAGPFGGPEMSAKSTREFDIPQSACGIPSTAVAYSLNVTVVPSGPLGYLSMWPTGATQPLVSTLNSIDGRVKANAAITPAGTNGGVDVYVTDVTNVILDINGYFVPAGTSSALAFYPVAPCRVADTRNAAGPLGGPSIGAKSSRNFPVQSSSCGIPATASAYSLNVTAVPHTTLGYLSIWPTGTAQPLVSTLNSYTGTVVANAALVPAGSSGDVSVYVTDDTDVILDIDGYFAPPGTGGLALYTVAPCRVLDTRTGAGAFSGVLPVNIKGSACAPPPPAQGYVLNATVVPPHPLGFLTLWPDGSTQPLVSTLNSIDGVVTSNMAIVPTSNGSIDAYAIDPTNLILDISSYFAP
jgi:uncharacterized repeat protein (TIGR03803 family)